MRLPCPKTVLLASLVPAALAARPDTVCPAGGTYGFRVRTLVAHGASPEAPGVILGPGGGGR